MPFLVVVAVVSQPIPIPGTFSLPKPKVANKSHWGSRFLIDLKKAKPKPSFDQKPLWDYDKETESSVAEEVAQKFIQANISRKS
jgi:hypothetical protein